MIKIITGDIGSGKTSKIESIYTDVGGDGFITRKIFYNNKNIGQRIYRLTSGKNLIFALKTDFLHRVWDEECRFFNYSFSKTGLDFARKIITESMEYRFNPIFIDEIGPLEIYLESGLFYIFKKLISAPLNDLYISVRTDCLNDFIIKFEISDYSVTVL